MYTLIISSMNATHCQSDISDKTHLYFQLSEILTNIYRQLGYSDDLTVDYRETTIKYIDHAISEPDFSGLAIKTGDREIIINKD